MMAQSPRMQLLVRTARAMVLVGVLAVAYIASYPPAIHLLGIKATQDPPGWDPDGWWTIYAPMECLIDKSPLDGPILWWSGVCGTRSEVLTASLHRSQIRRRPPR
jgi:hypothetical protein